MAVQPAGPGGGEGLVLFALAEEASAFRRRLGGGARVRIRLTGVGAANARAAAQEVLRGGRPAWVLSAGFAGGLDPALAFGRVLYEAERGSALEAALEAGGAVRGRFHCADRVLVTAAEKASAWQATGASAVEMESGVLRICFEQGGIPVATVRVISDTALESLPLDFNRYATPDLRMDYLRLLGALAWRPAVVLELLRFRRRLGRAAGVLASVLWEAVRRLEGVENEGAVPGMVQE